MKVALLLFVLMASAWSAESALAAPPLSLSAGESHTCAVKADGTPTCWGARSVPPGVGASKAINTDGGHTCVIRADDTPFCWGDDKYGQTTIPAGIGTVTQIDAGGFHTCAVKTDGTPVCWGDDSEGQRTVPPGVGTVTQIAAGEYQTCALETDGTPVCWGSDFYGEASIPAGIGKVTQITVGWNHSCALRTDGTPVCWGDHSNMKVTGPNGVGKVTQIAAGGSNSCVVKADGTPICWGGINITVPAGVQVAQFAVGGFHVCAVRPDGYATCWGGIGAGKDGGPPQFSSAPPPSLVAGGPLLHTYVAGPEAPVARFFLSSGTFPPGVKLDETTGVLAGTATADGTYKGAVTATNDVYGPDATQAFSITVDTVAPAAPTGLAVSPASPSGDRTPRVTGAAEAGSTVRFYGDGACAGTPLAIVGAAALASPGVLIQVPADSTTTFHATATDGAGNVSACSTSGPTYVHQTPIPQGPPSSPGPAGPPTPPTAPAPRRIVTGLSGDARCLGTGRRGRREITVRYVTGEAARITFTLQRRIAPKLVAPRSCPRRLPAGDGATTPSGERIVYRTAGTARKLTFTRTQQAGRHSVKLLRAFGGGVLTPGFYRLLVEPSVDGVPGRAASLYLWVLAPPRARRSS